MYYAHRDIYMKRSSPNHYLNQCCLIYNAYVKKKTIKSKKKRYLDGFHKRWCPVISDGFLRMLFVGQVLTREYSYNDWKRKEKLTTIKIQYMNVTQLFLLHVQNFSSNVKLNWSCTKHAFWTFLWTFDNDSNWNKIPNWVFQDDSHEPQITAIFVSTL